MFLQSQFGDKNVFFESGRGSNADDGPVNVFIQQSNEMLSIYMAFAATTGYALRGWAMIGFSIVGPWIINDMLNSVYYYQRC